MTSFLIRPVVKFSAVVALQMLATGCATIGSREVRARESILAQRVEEVPDPNEIAVTAETLDATHVHLRAVHVCRTRAVRDVGRIETWENYNATPSTTWAATAVAAGGIGFGALTLADSANVHPSNGSSRTYNPVGPGGAQAIGGTILAVGLISATAAIIDVAKAQGSEPRRERYDVRDEAKGTETPCAEHPAKEIELQMFSERAYPLGKTEPGGELIVDLNTVVPENFDWTQKRVAIVHIDRDVGELDLSAFFEWREAQAWRDLPLLQCEQPTTADACKELRTFLKRYPEGVHASEVRRILLRVAPELQRLSEEAAWAATSAEEAAPCRESSFQTPDAAERSCAPYRNYLAAFANGPHSEEARRILEAAEKRVANLVKAEEQAAERELKRQEQERLKQQREIEAEEKREQAEVRNRCVATCRHKCMASHYANKELCLKGCLNVECDNNLCEGYCQADCATWSKAGTPNCASTCIYGRCGGEQ